MPHASPHVHDHAPGHDAGAHAELLEMDARVFASCLAEVADWALASAPEDVRVVVDLGAGTGVGSHALARRFPAAEIVAVDRSSAMLDRVRAKDLGARLRTVQADLDDGWPAEAGRADVVWASSSLHEVADPEALLRDVRAAVASGGLLVVVEIDELPRFLPDDVAPGLEDRISAALTEAGWNAHPDWRPHLERAGLDAVEQRSFPVRVAADADLTARYARAWLRHVRRGLDGRVSAADIDTLDLLLAGSNSVLDRGDLVVRGSRTAWAARIPTDPSEEDPR